MRRTGDEFGYFLTMVLLPLILVVPILVVALTTGSDAPRPDDSPLQSVRVVSTTAPGDGDGWNCGKRGSTVLEVIDSGERMTVCNQLGTPGETFNYRLP